MSAIKSYEKNTLKELISLCRNIGVKGYSGKKKDELIALLNKTNIKQASELDDKEETESETEEASACSGQSSFTNQTMLTCIGNKRKLIPHIKDIVADVRKALGKDKLVTIDGFAGSSVVGRELSYYSEAIYSNDMEYYAYLISKCSLETPTGEEQESIRLHINKMNSISDEVFKDKSTFQEGIIAKHYAPKDTENVQEGERCFYTRENALVIDNLRQYIFNLSKTSEASLFAYLMVPLLCKASIHTNTSGVFRGFHKKAGVGHFGGTGESSLPRIKGQIKLDMPVWNNENKFKAHCSNLDFNELIKSIPDDSIDLIYLDPPYNQHSYGANYFMLNIIASEELADSLIVKDEGQEVLQGVSPISGVPKDWKRSDYYYKQSALKAMKELVDTGLKKSKFLLISYNDEGFIGKTDWLEMLSGLNVRKYEIEHGIFGGCRNFKSRKAKVMELLFLVSLPIKDKNEDTCDHQES